MPGNEHDVAPRASAQSQPVDEIGQMILQQELTYTAIQKLRRITDPANLEFVRKD